MNIYILYILRTINAEEADNGSQREKTSVSQVLLINTALAEKKQHEPTSKLVDWPLDKPAVQVGLKWS